MNWSCDNILPNKSSYCKFSTMVLLSLYLSCKKKKRFLHSIVDYTFFRSKILLHMWKHLKICPVIFSYFWGYGQNCCKMFEKESPKTSKTWELQNFPTIGSHIVTFKFELWLRGDLRSGVSKRWPSITRPEAPCHSACHRTLPVKNNLVKSIGVFKVKLNALYILSDTWLSSQFYFSAIKLKDLRDLEHLWENSILKTIIHCFLTAAPSFCS